MSETGGSSQRLKVLLLVCQLDADPLISPDFLASLPFVHGLEIAVSRSARERRPLHDLAGRWPVLFPDDLDSLLQRLNVFDCLVVSPLSLNTLAKFALGLRDSFPALLLAAAATDQKPILLDGGAVRAAFGLTHPHFQRIYRHYWENVQGPMVRGCTADTLEELLGGMIRSRQAEKRDGTATGRAVITRDDVMAARNGLTPLRVARGALITDLAREEAEKLGVVFSFE